MSKVTVKFFAHVREQAGVDGLELEIGHEATLNSIRNTLSEQSERFKQALSGNVVMACNQTMAKGNTRVHAGDEVAFFPPVTGG